MEVETVRAGAGSEWTQCGIKGVVASTSVHRWVVNIPNAALDHREKAVRVQSRPDTSSGRFFMACIKPISFIWVFGDKDQIKGACEGDKESEFNKLL